MESLDQKSLSQLLPRKDDKGWVIALKVVGYCIVIVSFVIGIAKPLLAPVFPSGQGQIPLIRGVVHNEEDKPVVGATVLINGGVFQTSTDDYGVYVFNNISNLSASNPIHIGISKDGYRRFTRIIERLDPHVFIDVHLHKQ